MSEDEMRIAIIRAVASLDGYENPNTDKGDYWDKRCEPVYRVFAEARRSLEERAFLAGRVDALDGVVADIEGERDRAVAASRRP